ncbi:MAG TPA: glycosyltransferase family 2 protein [Anaerolineae bacterium]|nr:glycosyltransferase family 2 protein [Anaerolineae bacterium]
MWRDHTVSVVLPTYNEKASIRRSIQELEETGYVDEIIVVNNNAAPGTSDEVAQTSAREIHEPRQGYGFACQRGLSEATGTYVILSEPDGTFRGADILKLLAYADDADLVLGSRTAKGFIWKDANMGCFLRWGNWAVAKLLEMLFNTTNLTDVGCTMRLIHRTALGAIQGQFTVGGSYFGPQMILLALRQRLRVIQIPVNYQRRVGKSMATGNKFTALIIGLQMIGMILGYRVKTWLRPSL